MSTFDQGGGGGPAPALGAAVEDNLSLAKPYDLSWPLTADSLQQLNEMLATLFDHAIGNISTSRLLGRYSRGQGRAQAVQIGSNLALSPAGVLSASAAAATTEIVLTGATAAWATGTITDTQMKAIATPITLLPAVPGKMIVLAGNFVAWANVSVFGGTAVTLTVRYTGTLQTLLAAFTGISTTGHRFMVGAGTFNIQTATDYRNRAVEIVGNANAGATYASESGYHYAFPYFLL